MTVSLEAGLVGRDEPTLAAFYVTVMGFELFERLEFDVGVVGKFRRGDARIKIFFPRAAVDPVAVPVADSWFRPGGWRYAALSVQHRDEVDALAAGVEAAGGAVLMVPTNHRPGARMAMISDPEGNAWEILAEVSDQIPDQEGDR